MSEAVGARLTERQAGIVARMRRFEETLPRELFADIPQWVLMEWHFERLNEERARNGAPSPD